MLAAQLVLRRVGVVDVVRAGRRSVMSASCPPSTRSTSASTRRVAAQQPMVAQDPEVARPADRILRRLRNLVLGLVACRLAVGHRQQPLQLGGIEADQVEVEALVPQPGQLLRQQLLAPSCLQGELVVGDQVRPLLRLAQVLEPDHRHLGEPELPRRQQPAVAGEDAALLVDQHRVRPAELDHRAPRSDRPAPRCGCAGCARTGAAGRSARARSGRRARPARRSAVRRSTANLMVRRGGANLGATPATVRRQVRTLAGLRNSGILRASGGQVRRVVRTANPESRAVASEISRGPPVSVFAKEGPRSVERKVDLRLRYSTSVSDHFICALLAFAEHRRCATKHLLAPIKAPPPNQNSPPEDWASCRAHSASLARPYML